MQLNFVEIKAGKPIMSDVFDGLNWLENLSGKKDLIKTLVYGGNEPQTRSLGEVIPWQDFGK